MRYIELKRIIICSTDYTNYNKFARNRLKYTNYTTDSVLFLQKTINLDWHPFTQPIHNKNRHFYFKNIVFYFIVVGAIISRSQWLKIKQVNSVNVRINLIFNLFFSDDFDFRNRNWFFKLFAS